jgi:3-phenylpropionate/cinnamic acid dioxygenase small subunit
MAGADAGRDLQQAAERLLYYEAWLLDARRLHEWLDLFTDDARYALYVREKVQGSLRAPAPPGSGPDAAPVQLLFAEDKAGLALRVRRLDTQLAHSERPPSITRHLITNVLVTAAEGAELTVRSNFLVHQARLETDDYTFFGQREDRLRQVDGEWKIAARTVVLDHLLLPRALTIFF